MRPPSGPDQLWLYVVNRDLERDVEAELALANLTITGVTADVLNGPAYWSLNTQEHPDAVTLTSRELGATTTVTFPAHSLTRLRIQ